MNKKAYGFTLVELLIVIVIIAILAAIAFVSYRGIIEHARNASIEVAADSYVKAMTLYKMRNGGYPAAHDIMNNPTHAQGWRMVCLGKPSDYPATDLFDEGQCGDGANGLNVPSHGKVMYSEAMSQVLRTELSDMPSTKEAKVDPRIRGFIYTSWQWAGHSDDEVNTSLNYSTIQYFVHTPNYQCPKGWVSSANYDGYKQTRCVITLK